MLYCIKSSSLSWTFITLRAHQFTVNVKFWSHTLLRYCPFSHYNFPVGFALTIPKTIILHCICYSCPFSNDLILFLSAFCQPDPVLVRFLSTWSCSCPLSVNLILFLSFFCQSDPVLVRFLSTWSCSCPFSVSLILFLSPFCQPDPVLVHFLSARSCSCPFSVSLILFLSLFCQPDPVLVPFLSTRSCFGQLPKSACCRWHWIQSAFVRTAAGKKYRSVFHISFFFFFELENF